MPSNSCLAGWGQWDDMCQTLITLCHDIHCIWAWTTGNARTQKWLWNLCSHIIKPVLEKEVSCNPKRWWWHVTAKYLKWTICLKIQTSEAVMHNSANDIPSAKESNKGRIPTTNTQGKHLEIISAVFNVDCEHKTLRI